MEYFNTHIPQVLIALGIIALTIEVAILGFSTFILFFIGLSLIITGSAMWLELLPDTMTSILLSNAIVSFLLSLLLWSPLKKMQESSDKKEVKSDFDGIRFVIEEEVSLTSKVKHSHSGIDWLVKSRETIPAGSEVEVTKAEVGVLWVKIADND